MKRAMYNLPQVKGAAYAALLQHALAFCDSFILVIRHSIDVKESAQAVLDRLGPFLIRQEEKTEWPGTRLFEHTAQVNTFQLSPATVSVLTEVAESLFDWTQPGLPEDLCLFRRDGEPWLVTIAHEKDAYVMLLGDEAEALAKSIPELSLQQHQDVVS